MNVVIEQIVEVNLAFYRLIILRNLQLYLLWLENFPRTTKNSLIKSRSIENLPSVLQYKYKYFAKIILKISPKHENVVLEN